jgi:hypothetical protein
MVPRYRRLYPVPVLVALMLPLGFSQEAPRKEPFVFIGKAETARPTPPGRRAAKRPVRFAMDRLSVFENAKIDFTVSPPRTGVHRDLPAGIIEKGQWTALEDGRRVWRLEISSDGASALRVYFDDFEAGDGKVWIYGPDGFVDGPYSGRGIFDDGAFWSALIESDSIVVEYEPAETAESVPFRLTKVSHRVAAPSSGREGTALLRSIGIAADPIRLGPLADEGKDPAAACNLDVACYSEWSQAAAMVGLVEFEYNGQPADCSGTLVATRNNSSKPYFLTAAHCIGSEAEARSAEVFWQYQTSQCRGAHPTSRGNIRSAPGGNLLAASSPLVNGDYSLVRLREVPSGVLFSGWDAGDPVVLSSVVGIHHPRGSHKRISFGTLIPSQDITVGDAEISADSNWWARWNSGIIEPGSSGSPIFISPGYTVGVLSWGLFPKEQGADDVSPQCELPVELRIAGYGRMSAIYPAIRDYLEDLPSTEVTPSPAEVTFRVRNGALQSASPVAVAVNTASATAVRFNARADAQYIGLSANTGTTTASNPGRLQVSIDPAQFKNNGTFRSTVTLTQGSAAPKYINVRVDSVVDKSNVTASVAPNPVYEQEPDASGMRFSFGVRIAESAGVGTRLVSMKINGEDYSSEIGRIFPTTSIPASGAIEATIKANVTYVPSDQYLEFGGIDDASGQRWYRTVAVRFLPPR